MSGIEPFLMAAGTGAASAGGAMGAQALLGPDQPGMMGPVPGPGGGGSPIMAILQSLMQEQAKQKQMRDQQLAAMLGQMTMMGQQQPQATATVGQPQVIPGPGMMP